MRTIPTTPTPADDAARVAVVNAMRPWADELGAERLLAVLSYAVGQLVALQDQKTMTADRAMALVGANIEAGNADAITEVATGRLNLKP